MHSPVEPRTVAHFQHPQLHHLTLGSIMILSRALAFAALPLLAVATHGLHKARTNSGACSTGTLQCCESVGQVCPLAIQDYPPSNVTHDELTYCARVPTYSRPPLRWPTCLRRSAYNWVLMCLLG